MREVAEGAGKELPSILLIAPASISKIAMRYPQVRPGDSGDGDLRTSAWHR